MRVHEFLRERVCGWFAQRIHNPEEPYALIALVRVCGGSGGATSQFYPEDAGMLSRQAKSGALGWAAREPRLKFAEGVQWVRVPLGKGCHPPKASLASVGKAESGSVDSGY